MNLVFCSPNLFVFDFDIFTLAIFVIIRAVTMN